MRAGARSSAALATPRAKYSALFGRKARLNRQPAGATACHAAPAARQRQQQQPRSPAGRAARGAARARSSAASDVELPLRRQAPGGAEEAHPDIRQHRVGEQAVRHRQMRERAPRASARGQPIDQISRAGLSGAIQGIASHSAVGNAVQRLHARRRRRTRQEDRKDPPRARRQERPRLPAMRLQRLHDHQPAQHEERIDRRRRHATAARGRATAGIAANGAMCETIT